jgi:hypothetical protein
VGNTIWRVSSSATPIDSSASSSAGIGPDVAQ